MLYPSSPHCCDFYPRSPCGERLRLHRAAPGESLFLSTLSLRRATVCIPCGRLSLSEFLSTLSLRRATVLYSVNRWTTRISIHALLAESDGFYADMMALTAISIHALLAESDFM